MHHFTSARLDAWSRLLGLMVALFGLLHASGRSESAPAKTESAFFHLKIVQTLRANLAKNPAARAKADIAIASAQAWLERSDDDLWSAMFGATIRRSWMVWSNGFCPSCKKDVPMYAWKIDGLSRPWKAACPHCAETFPKNDFAAFYRSGLDPQGVFAADRANRALLFNAEHPAADDPARTFGVDDGTGYHDGTHRWHFIGAYLIYGQWKQVVLKGIRTLATAYVLTGDAVYAHKAAILLDRVADLYPTFDYLTQGLSYEKADPIVGAGLVSVWHDACPETMELALAYDMIFPALAADSALVNFLAAKAAAHGMPNAKRSAAAIQQNIENGILREVLRRPEKILSNYPNTDVTLIIAQAVLGWPGNRDGLVASLQTMLTQATAVDGLSGEKGLGAYSTYAPRTIANVLSLFDRLAPDLLATLVNRVPNLTQLFKFHVDSWLGETYYPKIGDAGAFGQRDLNYAGAAFSQFAFDPAKGGIPFVSDFSLFWKLHEITGDPTYVKLLYRANQQAVTDLPYDLLVDEPAQFQAAVAAVIREHGTSLAVASVNKAAWGLALLHSGAPVHRRSVWLDYDIGGNHGRGDGMNLGLYAHGLEILSGFGYPPVQFGGWHSPRANWYKMTAAHNTVVVDGRNQFARFDLSETEPLPIQLNPRKGEVRGQTTAWVAGAKVQLVRADGPTLVQTAALQTYERSLLLVDLSAEDSYVLDIFRVAGGRDHAKFLHGYFGTATATGIDLQPMAAFGHGTQMRNFRGGSPAAGWQVDWKIEDRYGYLPPGEEVHLRTTELTRRTHAALAESWLMYPDRGENKEAWVPSLVVRRRSENAEPLRSTFVALLEPYRGQSRLDFITRLDLHLPSGLKAGNEHVAVAVAQTNGQADLLIATAPTAPGTPRPRYTESSWACTTDAEFALVRRGKTGPIEHLLLARGKFLQCGAMRLELKSDTAGFEAAIKDGELEILRGSPDEVQSFQATAR